MFLGHRQTRWRLGTLVDEVSKVQNLIFKGPMRLGGDYGGPGWEILQIDIGQEGVIAPQIKTVSTRARIRWSTYFCSFSLRSWH